MESSDDGAWLKTSGSIVIFNPLEEVWNAYEDTRMGATIDAYMNGYDDPVCRSTSRAASWTASTTACAAA